MNFLSTFVTFQNLHEVRRLCHWGPIIALSVIAICSTMAILDSIIWYWPLDTTGGSINFIMLINWTVLILYNYFNAMFVGPGYIPLGWKPVSTPSFVFLLFVETLWSHVIMLKEQGYLCNRRTNRRVSFYNTAECVKATRLPGPTTVESVTGNYNYYQSKVGFLTPVLDALVTEILRKWKSTEWGDHMQGVWRRRENNLFLDVSLLHACVHGLRASDNVNALWHADEPIALCPPKTTSQFPQHSSPPLPPLPQVCNEDGPPLPLDQQLLRPLEPRLLHQLPAAGSAGLLTRCHYFHYDHVHTAVWEGEWSS